jgi:nucleoid-associated protein YgaU
VEEMARYSKSIWPSLPTVVRAPPGWLRRSGLTWQYLDIAWAQWAAGSEESEGKTPEQFRDENVAEAKAQGLGLVMGMNLLNGGDGSSGEPGNRSGRWEMSAAEVVRVGTVLAETPYACAVLSWRYDAAFEQRPGTPAALDKVAAAAADRGGISCLQRGQ